MPVTPITDPDDPDASGRPRLARRSPTGGCGRWPTRSTAPTCASPWREPRSSRPPGPVILAPVHRSNIDFLVVSEVTKRKLFYMAKDSLWRAPRFGTFLESIGAFPVHREGADRLALDRAQDVLERGEALILFPEGTRRSGPVVEELHEGAAFLAARTGAPIVPIGIGGSAAAMPKGSKMVRSGEDPSRGGRAPGRPGPLGPGARAAPPGPRPHRATAGRAADASTTWPRSASRRWPGVADGAGVRYDGP